MDEERLELVRVDATGTAHPVGKTASQRMRARQGAFRLMPAPDHLIVMRYVGEDGRRDPEDGRIFRLAGEITAPGAICDIVGLIGQGGWTGELVVLDGNTTRAIYFDRSHVVAATSNVEGERLGEVLYRYGALTRQQVSQALAAVTPEVRFGEAAVKLGFIARERLYQLMTRQAEEIVFAVLLVADGMFFFLDGYDDDRIAVRQNLSVQALLMDGVRRMDEMRYFRDRIPSDQHVPERVPGKGPPADELAKVWGAVDGARSIAEIGRVVGQSEFEVTQALFQMMQGGLVTVQTPRPTGPAAVVALFNEAISLIFRELDALPGGGRGGEVREQLASFATGAGVYDALFRRAGPAADGTVNVEKITENIAVLVGPDQAEATLGQWLYEYVSFAVFVAEPFLRPVPEGASGPVSLRSAGVPSSSLSKRVAELVRPLAPKF